MTGYDVWERIRLERKKAEGYLLQASISECASREEKLYGVAIEQVMERLSSRQKDFLQARRAVGSNWSTGHERGRRGWVIPVQKKLLETLGEKVESWVSERTLKRWWTRIVSDVVLVKYQLQRDRQIK